MFVISFCILLGDNNEKDPIAKQDEIMCYVHTTSLIKKSGNLRYFNRSLQTSSSGIRGAVCFNPERKGTFDTLEKQKTLVKLSNYRTSTKYGRTDIVIQKYTNVDVPKEPKLHEEFQYHPMPDTNAPTAINRLSDVAPNQLITVKGKLCQVSGVKTVIVTDS